MLPKVTSSILTVRKPDRTAEQALPQAGAQRLRKVARYGVLRKSSCSTPRSGIRIVRVQATQNQRRPELQDVYVDVETDESQFATVKEGLSDRHLTFVPLSGIRVGISRLSPEGSNYSDRCGCARARGSGRWWGPAGHA